VGSYAVRVTVSDGDDSGSAGTVIHVSREDAGIWLDNENSELVDDPGSDDSGPFSLFAYVQESSDPDDATCGNEPGDINNAVVSMELVAVGPGPGATGACSRVGDNGQTGYAKIAEFECTFDHVGVNTYLVQATVAGDYYAGGPAEDVLVVYDPSLGFTTAGGWFYWPGSTDKTNFGYTMKYNKKGNKVQGSLLLIRHTGAGNYRIKSNALYGLALGEFTQNGSVIGWASFSGKCTYQVPSWDEPEGNHEFLVYVEDRGEPGAGIDKFWIEVQDDGGHLSLNTPVAGNLVTLDGGNVVVPHQAKKTKVRPVR
jgi:hypothetical protein